MGFFDDISVRLQQSAQNQLNDINSYIQNRVTDVVVKIGQPPKGNLSAAELAQGQQGAGVAQAAPTGASVQNSAQASQISEGLQKYAIPLALALGLSFVLFSKKSRG